MKHPAFSIIVPVYGVEKYIERCACSLFDQDYDKVQYIFVNDGTKDRSIEILEALIHSKYQYLKPQIVIINKKNAGLPAARKTGMECATGDYILHVDSDDYIEADTLKKIAKASEETDADLIYFNIINEEPKGMARRREREYDDYTRKDFAINIINGKSDGYLVTKCFKRSLYTSHELHFAPYAMHEDIYLSLQLITYSTSVYHLDAYLYHYDRNNPEAITVIPKRKRHYQFCANMMDLYSRYADSQSPLRYLFPFIFIRVAWYSMRERFDFFQTYPEMTQFVNAMPLSTRHYIPIPWQLLVKGYVKYLLLATRK